MDVDLIPDAYPDSKTTQAMIDYDIKDIEDDPNSFINDSRVKMVIKSEIVKEK